MHSDAHELSKAHLRTAAELDDAAAVALGRAALRPRLELVQALAFGGNFEAQLTAGVRLAVERLSDRGWAADVAYGENFNVEIAGIVGDVQLVAGMNLARRFDALPSRLDPPEFAGFGAE